MARGQSIYCIIADYEDETRYRKLGVDKDLEIDIYVGSSNKNSNLLANLKVNKIIEGSVITYKLQHNGLNEMVFVNNNGKAGERI